MRNTKASEGHGKSTLFLMNSSGPLVNYKAKTLTLQETKRWVNTYPGMYDLVVVPKQQ